MLKKLLEQLTAILNEQDLFEVITLDEAVEQLKALDKKFQKRIATAIEMFSKVGTKYKNINRLDDTLFELKPEGVRAYFVYHPTKRSIIIIGFIALKKSQKAPPEYIEQAHHNIDKYLKEEQ